MKFELQPTQICPACRKKRGDKPVYDLNQFSIYDCRFCGLRFIDPSLTDREQMQIYNNPKLLAELNSAMENYYAYDPADTSSRTFKDYQLALSRAEEKVSEKTLCELGCGAGAFLKIAKKMGWKVTGIDSNQENTAELKNAGIEAICGDLFEYEDLPRHDCVVLWDVIEHPRNPGDLLQVCRKLLKPNGVLIVAAPCYPNFVSILAGIIAKLTGHKAALKKMYMFEHISYFSPKSLGALLASQNYEVIRAWKTETDLNRYAFSPLTRIVLNIMFAIARCVNLQNRQIVIAKVV